MDDTSKEHISQEIQHDVVSSSSPEKNTNELKIQKETTAARVVTFGSIEVKEDLDVNLLTDKEKVLYAGNFSVLKDVVDVADNNINRMVLTNPEIVSGIVGLQPVVSLDTAEAGVVYQSFRHAGIDFNQNFSFLTAGKESNRLKFLINCHMAENVLRTYQKELGIMLSEEPLKRGELLTHITSLLNGSDLKKANLAHGLLSGFPLEDCQFYIGAYQNKTSMLPLPKFGIMEDVEVRFGEQIITDKEGNKIYGRWNPIPNLDPEDYSMEGSRNHYLPDLRANHNPSAPAMKVEGFGLRWMTSFPAKEDTIRHCQKLLQIDRQVGLLNFVNKQRGMFNVNDNMKAINLEKKILNKPPGKAGPVGATLIGMYLVFDMVKNFIMPPKKSVEES